MASNAVITFGWHIWPNLDRVPCSKFGYYHVTWGNEHRPIKTQLLLSEKG